MRNPRSRRRRNCRSCSSTPGRQQNGRPGALRPNYFPALLAPGCADDTHHRQRARRSAAARITSRWSRRSAWREQRVWLSSGYFVPPHQEREDVWQEPPAEASMCSLVVPSIQRCARPPCMPARRLRRSAGGRRTDLRNAERRAAFQARRGGRRLDRDRLIQPRPPQCRVQQRGRCDHSRCRHRGRRSRHCCSATWQCPRQITLHAWQRRSFDERLDEMKARLWQYWM